MTAAASVGRFELQHCSRCGAVQYPPREACHRCLSVELLWTLQSGEGELISDTILFHSHAEYFRKRLPWRVGMVRLDAGPTAICHLHGATQRPPTRVRVTARLDRAGQGVLFALPQAGAIDLHSDRQLREMTCDPRDRNVLITGGETTDVMALGRMLVRAGASHVWLGCQEGSQVGEKVDILIHDCAEAPSAAPSSALQPIIDAFAPVMRARAADGNPGAIAWVNILSTRALPGYPGSTFSAGEAASHSLSQALRAHMRPAGVRVVNVFTDRGNWDRADHERTTAAQAVAQAVVKALQDGIEEVFPADTPQVWLTSWIEGVKMSELEPAGKRGGRPRKDMHA